MITVNGFSVLCEGKGPCVIMVTATRGKGDGTSMVMIQMPLILPWKYTVSLQNAERKSMTIYSNWTIPIIFSWLQPGVSYVPHSLSTCSRMQLPWACLMLQAGVIFITVTWTALKESEQRERFPKRSRCETKYGSKSERKQEVGGGPWCSKIHLFYSFSHPPFLFTSSPSPPPSLPAQTAAVG